ncbi:MAG TPA: crosslink repair DNA glycosylase YcaQ family protein [Candidatus Dormibacteraeota bacterium]|nr:crosslink repair DNA glycosylase YcaQ family protein [Candidatus Dormibacteraeota bacterium]
MVLVTGRSLAAKLDEHRRALVRKHRIATARELSRFVDACGFCYAFTAGDLPLPACFDHLATRSVDRMWGWMWEWKDTLPEEGKLYYGRLLKGKPTFVSRAFLPYFYAVHGRAGEDDDYLEDARAGRITDVGRRIYEALAERGETQTKRLRAQLGIESKEGRTEYAKAMESLQRLLYVTRVRAVGEGREDYNYTYDLFARRYPDAVERAALLTSGEAMREILLRAIALAGALPNAKVAAVFGWDAERTDALIAGLERERGVVRDGIGRDQQIVWPRLLSGAASGRARARTSVE